MSETKGYEAIAVSAMSPACGAIIGGVDLSGELSNQQFDEIHSALLDCTVIIFRDQDISEAQQVAFTRRFGDLQSSAVSGFEKNEAHPEVDVLEYDADNPPHVTRDLWHTDFAGMEMPSLGTSLYARDIPPGGGDTIWVNSIAAYEALSERMKAHLDGLWAYHDRFQAYDEHVRPELWEQDYQAHLRAKKGAYTPALHPVVRTHPVTGKRGLFVNESMTSIDRKSTRRPDRTRAAPARAPHALGSPGHDKKLGFVDFEPDDAHPYSGLSGFSGYVSRPPQVASLICGT